MELVLHFWHGGGVHGIVILIERYLMKHDIFNHIPLCIRRLYTLIIVAFGWVVFLLPHIEVLLSFFKGMFGLTHYNYIPFSFVYFFDCRLIFILLVCIIFSFKLIPNKFYVKINEWNKNSLYYNAMKYSFMILLLMISVMKILSGSYSPFIYFQF